MFFGRSAIFSVAFFVSAVAAGLYADEAVDALRASLTGAAERVPAGGEIPSEDQPDGPAGSEEAGAVGFEVVARSWLLEPPVELSKRDARSSGGSLTGKVGRVPPAGGQDPGSSLADDRSLLAAIGPCRGGMATPIRRHAPPIAPRA